MRKLRKPIIAILHHAFRLFEYVFVQVFVRLFDAGKDIQRWSSLGELRMFGPIIASATFRSKSSKLIFPAANDSNWLQK